MNRLELMKDVETDTRMLYHWVNILDDNAIVDPPRIREIRRQANAISRRLTQELKR